MKMLGEHGIIEALRFIVENTDDLMFIKNKDFVYIAASKRYAQDCVRCSRAEDVIGKTDFELFEDQTLAARYRATDEALLASGEPRIEFREASIGENGKKDLWLTTKYLLRDRNGEPMAILGQHHNTGDQVQVAVQRNRDINKNIALALGKSFFATNYADLTTKMVHAEDVMQGYVELSPGFEETMMQIIPDIVGTESQAAYRKTFSRQNLLEQAAHGKTHHQEEFLMKLSEDHYEWVETVVELVKNPLTDDVSGVAYSKSTQKAHMEHELLASALKMDYLFAAIVFKDTDEFYVYNSDADSFGKRLDHFWEVAFSGRSPQCLQETIAYMNEYYNKEKMCAYLDSHTEFSYSFNSNYLGYPCRLESKFRYLDPQHRTILVTMRDITDQRLQEQWKYDSEHDALTGLLNRKTIFEKSRTMLQEHPYIRFAMLHCDVRRFHLYNTFFGEKAGDRLLRKIAEQIQGFQEDYCCYACGRIESDVFCVCFPFEEDVFEGHVRACTEMLNQFSPDFPLSLAIGVYVITNPSMSIEAMFARATIAAKSRANNLFSLASRYDDTMERNLKDTQLITAEMISAIQQEQFEVYLQPKYSLRSEKIVGAEALSRWKHPERGMISPGKFIPVFEQNGFITELDRYMWEHVCRILRRWQDEGRPMYPVSVNVSRVSIYSYATVPFLKSLLEKYQIDPNYLELELTETAYMDDPKDLKRMLTELQEAGFKILMDDFGSGYSSLNTLRDLPVDILKLDMRFLSTTQDDTRANAVLSSVVRMSKLLSLPIVAEGVETREQAEYLRSIGCEYVQGFLFARPMPTAEYEALLNTAEPQPEAAADDPLSPAEADVVLEESFQSLGLLEYAGDCFAYLRTNKQFLTEFDLVENLKPASRVFRDHLDDASYSTLLWAFANCADTKRDTVCSLQWLADDGAVREYHGYVHYHGNIGNYADLVVTFMNVTDIDRINFSASAPESDSPRVSELSTDKTNAIVRALDNTGVHLFMYYPQTKHITVPAEVCKAYQCSPVYENMPQSFADDFVYEGDYPGFNEMYYAIDRGEKNTTAVFHSKDLNFCHHVTLTTVSWLKNGQPYEAVGIIEDMSDTYKNERLVTQLKKELSDQSGNDEVDEALKTMATAVGNQYFAVYYIWLESRTYICFQEHLDGVLSLIGERGDYVPAWEQYISGYIDERDQQSVREFVDITTLAERIGHKTGISCTYRRNEIGWTRGQFIVGKRDENGKPLTIIYTVTDINEEMEAKRQKAAAEQEALQDPLTKLWNRKAFDQFKVDPDYKDTQAGLLLFDIDRFKGVNDQYGHEAGDRLIVEVAQAVHGVLRRKDLVFRMGGDEFAVLLYNCNASIWKTACRKLETIHSELKSALSPDIQVTISAGLCVGKNGYYDEMYTLADRAMYNTKTNGRAGCTFVNADGKFIKEWHEQNGLLRKGEVLEKNSTVTWRLDKPKKEGLPHRMFGDDLFCAFVGLDRTASPEALYQACEGCVDADNFDIVSKAAQLAIADGKVEVVFAWNHPEKGVLRLRCSAYLEADTEDYYTFIGYVHVITGTRVVTMEDIDSRVKDSLQELYFFNFYIRLKDYSFKVYKAQPYMLDMLASNPSALDALDSYIKYMVAEESKETMVAFLDLTTLKQRLQDTNLIGANYNDPNIGWARASFIVVDRDKNGAPETVSLVVEAIK